MNDQAVVAPCSSGSRCSRRCRRRCRCSTVVVQLSYSQRFATPGNRSPGRDCRRRSRSSRCGTIRCRWRHLARAACPHRGSRPHSHRRSTPRPARPARPRETMGPSPSTTRSVRSPRPSPRRCRRRHFHRPPGSRPDVGPARFRQVPMRGRARRCSAQHRTQARASQRCTIFDDPRHRGRRRSQEGAADAARFPWDLRMLQWIQRSRRERRSPE